MTAPVPFKLQVLKAITAGIKTIAPDTGYVTDLRDFDPGDGEPQSRVFRGRAWFGDTDPLPMVSILEGVSPADDVAEPPVETTAGEHDWPILVQGFVNDDPANPTDPAYYLLADVRKWFATEKRRKAPGTHQPDPFSLGIDGRNRVVGLTIGPGVVRPADDVSSKSYFWMSVVIRIIDDAAVP